MRNMRIVDYRGKWCAEFRDSTGKRHRPSLGNLDATPENRAAAERAFADLARELAKPAGDAIADIMKAYLADKKGDDNRKGAVAYDRLEFAWKALKPFWGNLLPEHITRDKCREYVAERRQAGRQDGTIRREMNALAAAVRWAGKDGVFELPADADPRDRWLTHAEFQRLLAASASFHFEVFLHLAIATAGRKEAVLGLTWPQVRWDQNQIWLGVKQNGKPRATVPMTKTVRAVLQRAWDARAKDCEFVIQHGGKRVLNIRKAFELTVDRAGLGRDVTPHVLRHTAAVWMAHRRVPMAEIAQYLGHTSSKITERVYARFHPDYLGDAAAAVDVGQCSLVQMNPKPQK